MVPIFQSDRFTFGPVNCEFFNQDNSIQQLLTVFQGNLPIKAGARYGLKAYGAAIAYHILAATNTWFADGKTTVIFGGISGTETVSYIISGSGGVQEAVEAAHLAGGGIVGITRESYRQCLGYVNFKYTDVLGWVTGYTDVILVDLTGEDPDRSTWVVSANGGAYTKHEPTAGSVAWDDITGKPTSFPTTSAEITDATTVGKAILTAADAATARTAIGAGTSNLALGTTATTALAGNTAIPAASTTAPANLAAAAAVGTGTTFARADHVHAIPGASVGTVRGTVLIQAAIADLTAAPTEADFNGLLAALRAAGILAA